MLLDRRRGSDRMISRLAAMVRTASAVVLAVSSGALLLPALAGASPQTTVAVVSETGAFIGGGNAYLFVAPGDEINVAGGTAGLTVHAGPAGTGYDLTFEPPQGQTLVQGVYDHAARPSILKNPQRPGMNIQGNFGGCNELNGRFEVRDIATDAAGAISRLWVVYEQHCEHLVPATFGEVRYREPFTQSFSTTAPALVRWPPADLGRDGREVPVRVFAERAATHTRTIVAGGDAASFPVVLDGCHGQTLAVGDTCEVRVGFTPTTPGEHTATLHLEDATGGDYAAVLQGFAYGGTTRVVLHSDAADFVGEGKDWSFTPADSVIRAGGSGRQVSFLVNHGDWGATFRPGTNAIFAPGTYMDTELIQGDGPQLDVFGDGRGCNQATGQFTVSEAVFDVDGPLRFGASFEQHCEGAPAALRGNFDFRVGDTTTPAAWMSMRTGATPLPYTPAHSQPSSGACSARRFADARVILGTSADDRLYGTPEMEVLVAGDGKDMLWGRDGDDCLDGGAGPDGLSGGPGKDVVVGGKGNDVLSGGPGSDKLHCGTGDDTVYADSEDVVDADCEQLKR
jgi:RTX calcium-binding nonapeptide repeat (4 copies)